MADHSESMPTKKPLSNPVVADIRHEWDWVRPLLEELKSSHEHINWIPEDVYHECRTGNAVLWVAPEGFVITTLHTDEYTNEKSLVVWIACAKKIGRRNVLTYLPFFEDVAKGCDCSSVEVWSFIRHMEEYLAPLGFEVATRVFRKMIP